MKFCEPDRAYPDTWLQWNICEWQVFGETFLFGLNYRGLVREAIAKVEKTFELPPEASDPRKYIMGAVWMPIERWIWRVCDRSGTQHRGTCITMFEAIQAAEAKIADIALEAARVNYAGKGS